MMQNYEKHAVVAMMASLVKSWNENSLLIDKKTELESQIAAGTARITDCEAGLRVLGYDLSIGDTWANLIQEFGVEVRQALDGPHIQGQPEVNLSVEARQDRKHSTPSIAQLILFKLQEFGPVGVKAEPLRQYLKSKFGIETHPKTVGMTLYRLSQEKPPLVHRKGHLWFFGPPASNETKNTGDDTPRQLSIILKEGTADGA
jgi:hypothetical protein